MISETIYSNQNKLIGQSLAMREHGMSCINLAFAVNEGQEDQYSLLSP